MSDDKLLRELLRRSLAAFVERAFQEIEPHPFVYSPFIEVFCDYLESVERGETTRLIVNLPPRHLKSIIASVCIVAWALGRTPGRRIVLVSYGYDIVERHVRFIREIMKSPWYRKLFPNTRISKLKDTASAFETTEGGRVIATTIEGPLTGQGGDLIIVDDPIKAADVQHPTYLKRVNDWVSNTLLSRLDNKATDQVVLVMQRLHVNDLSGYLIQSGGWRHLCLPALAVEEQSHTYRGNRVFRRRVGDPLFPERETKEVLDNIKREQGSFHFTAQYQQEPIPAEGNHLRYEWLRTYHTPPIRSSTTQLIQSWDLGVKDGDLNDYSACVTLLKAGGDFYLLDVWRGRSVFPALKARIADHAARFRPDRILIEDCAHGRAMIELLRATTKLNIIPVSPKGAEKVTRIQAQSVKIEAGRLYIPERREPWLDLFLQEYRAFPHGQHDDMVDALAYALAYGGHGDWSKCKVLVGAPPFAAAIAAGKSCEDIPTQELRIGRRRRSFIEEQFLRQRRKVA